MFLLAVISFSCFVKFFPYILHVIVARFCDQKIYPELIISPARLLSIIKYSYLFISQPSELQGSQLNIDR